MLQKLISKVCEYLPDADLEMITKAYHFCKKCHEGQ